MTPMVLFVAFEVFILGLCFGSFGNVLIARIPAGESVVKPRSRCPKCKKQILAVDNIPVISYLVLRGRCRNCKQPISIRYPLVELISGFIFLTLYLKLGLTITFLEYLVLAWGGFIASVIDLDHRILPDVFTLTGIVVGLIGSLLNPERHFTDALLGVVAGGGFLWAVALIYYAIRHEEGMGGGDIKLLGWIGSVLGWKSIIFCILVSSITGSLAGVLLALVKKSGMKTAIPFGPFLFFAAYLYMFIGPQVIRYYLSFFFPFSS